MSLAEGHPTAEPHTSKPESHKWHALRGQNLRDATDPYSIGWVPLQRKLSLRKVCGDITSEERDTSKNSLGFPASMLAKQREIEGKKNVL